MDSHFTNYKQPKGTKSGSEVKFILTGLPLCYTNGLRRALLSEIPCPVMDGRPDVEDMNVIENISGMTNEMLKHRLSLVPIRLQGNKKLEIIAVFNKDKGEYEYKFINSSVVPKIILNVKNNQQSIDERGLSSGSSFEVTSNDLKVDNDNDKKYFPVDIDTGDPLILHILNPGDQVNIEVKPKIMIGKEHACANPVGTVAMEHVFENNEEQIENSFQMRIQRTNNQRIARSFPPLEQEEIDLLRKDFLTTDIKRMIPMDKLDNPESTKFTIESIGFADANNLVSMSLIALQIKVNGIRRSLINSNPRIKINVRDEQTGECEISIKNENHTIGFILEYALRVAFIEYYGGIVYPFARYVSFREPHPLVPEIILKVIIDTESDWKALVEKELDTEELSNKAKLQEFIKMMLITTCNIVENDFANLNDEWKRVSKGSSRGLLGVHKNEEYDDSMFIIEQLRQEVPLTLLNNGLGWQGQDIPIMEGSIPYNPSDFD